VERSNSIAVVECIGSLVAERVEVLYRIEAGVVSGGYSWDGRFVEGEVAIAVRYPAEGNMIEGVEDWV